MLAMLPLLGFFPFMPEALQLHFMRCLKLGQVLGGTGGRLIIVELVLQAYTHSLSKAHATCVMQTANHGQGRWESACALC